MVDERNRDYEIIIERLDSIETSFSKLITLMEILVGHESSKPPQLDDDDDDGQHDDDNDDEDDESRSSSRKINDRIVEESYKMLKGRVRYDHNERI